MEQGREHHAEFKTIARYVSYCLSFQIDKTVLTHCIIVSNF